MQTILYIRAVVEGPTEKSLARATRYAMENITNAVDRLNIKATIGFYNSEGVLTRATLIENFDNPPEYLLGNRTDSATNQAPVSFTETGALSLSRLATAEDADRPRSLDEHLKLAGRQVFGGPKFGFSTAKIFASVNGWQDMFCGELEPLRWYEDASKIGGWNVVLRTLQAILLNQLGQGVTFDALSFSCEDTRLETTELAVSVFEFQSIYGITSTEYQTGVLFKDSLVWLWSRPEITATIRQLQTTLFAQPKERI